MSGRKFEAGNKKRKRKLKENLFFSSQKGAMRKYVKSSAPVKNVTEENVSQENNIMLHSNSVNEDNQMESNIVISSLSTQENAPTLPTSSIRMSGEHNSADLTEQEHIGELDSDTETNEDEILIDTDPYLWPDVITENTKLKLLSIGPKIVQLKKFPLNNKRRRFSKKLYTGKLSDGSSVIRRWLVYSLKSDSVYCFPCKLFSMKSFKLNSKDGYSDWKHASVTLNEHEVSSHHKLKMKIWINHEKEHKGKTSNSSTEKHLNLEKQRWRNVLSRLLSITEYLSSHNLAFQGKSSQLYTSDNGNFLGLVELLAKFDPVMEEHVRLAVSKKISDHYLGKNIQNEFINLLASSTTEKIVKMCKKSRYFSIIVDCTRDKSRIEQMTLTIRFVTTSDRKVNVEEHFLGFSEMEKSTGEGLADNILSEINKAGLNFKNCRGRGYDNGANMISCRKGVQARLLTINPKAFFVACGCHSLNLVISDAAKSCVNAVSFFGLLEAVYVFFSGSTQRWATLKTITSLTVKPLSTTRWEARIESVKALRYQISKIYDALLELSSTLEDVTSRFEAQNLARQIKNYNFIVSLSLWYEILFKVNLVSKQLQSESFDLQLSVLKIESLVRHFEAFREKGFTDILVTSRTLCDELDIEAKFEETNCLRPRRKKKQFSYESGDEPIMEPKEKYRIEFYNVILDTVLQSLRERFTQTKAHFEKFSFLHNLSKYKDNAYNDYLRDSCKNLEEVLSCEEQSDINAAQLCDEIKITSSEFPEGSTIYNSLSLIVENEYKELTENLYLALQIALTLPVTVASGERSFSRLKLIKSYLRSTMTEERLTGLAIISIENDITSKLNINDLLKRFEEDKQRKYMLT